jgi:NAD(P)-dependent dehydrogenase (short-subunit alcohol dehydrogenase family)
MANLSDTGRIAVITGANAGLGFETTRAFASEGIHVVMACRNAGKAEEARKQIESEVEGASLEVLPLDLADLSSVRAFAGAFRERHQQLDLLINNAGIMLVPYAQSVDGFEMQMAANYWGHYLLTSLLLDLMPDEPQSRIVSLSSLAHFLGLRRIRFEDIHWEKGYDKQQAYAQTKLACLLFSNELDRRLRAVGRSTIAVAAHPGMSMTELVKHIPKWQVAIARFTIAPLVTHPPQEAARSQIMAALDDQVAGGDYYGPQGLLESRGRPGKARQRACARDREAAARLWELSEELTGAEWPL